MIDTILIDALTPDCRIASLRNSTLIDIKIFRVGDTARAGDVILGRVKAVVPSIRGVFIDLGDQKDGFLPFPEKAQRSPFQEGEALIVQVRHEAMADKGARLTTRVSLPGRYAVYTPGQPGINVSRKGKESDLADRIAKAVAAQIEAGDGAIIRTAALTIGEDGLCRVVSELSALRDEWLDARRVCTQVKPPHSLICAPDPVLQALQGLDISVTKRIVVEGFDAFLRTKEYLADLEPGLLDRLHQHQGSEGVLESEGVEAEIDAALIPRVPLPSGGCLHIHETPACVTVDVDTDRATIVSGKKGRELIRQTNREAADAVMHALRLRNLSGNIVVDFIRDGDREAGRALLARLVSVSLDDPVPVEVVGFTRLGFVELMRRRRAVSLSDTLADRSFGLPNILKSPETLAYDALRQLHHLACRTPGRPITVRAHGDVIAMLHGKLRTALDDTTTQTGVPVTLEVNERSERGVVDVYNKERVESNRG